MVGGGGGGGGVDGWFFFLLQRKKKKKEVKSRMWSEDWCVTMFSIHLGRLLWMSCPEHAAVEGQAYDSADRLACRVYYSHHK